MSEDYDNDEYREIFNEIGEFNFFNGNLTGDFVWVFVQEFLIFYDKSFQPELTSQEQQKKFAKFMKFRDELDRYVEVNGLHESALSGLVSYSNIKSYPIEYNENYEDPLERPRMTKDDIFKLKNKWCKNKFFLKNELDVKVEHFNFILINWCELKGVDYGEDFKAINL